MFNPVEELARNLSDICGGLTEEQVAKLAAFVHDEYNRDPAVAAWLFAKLTQVKPDELADVLG